MHNNVAAAIRRGGYQVPASLECSYPQYLTYTPSSAGNSRKWTFSSWLRPGYVSTRQTLISTGASSTYYTSLWYDEGCINFYNTYGGTGADCQLKTHEINRDPSAYMHVLFIYDSANATEADRMQLWVDGVRVTVFDVSDLPGPSLLSSMTLAAQHIIGEDAITTGWRLRSNISQVALINDAVEAATSFGEWHPDCPQVWRPKRVRDVFSDAESWFLDFADNTSTTTIGYDTSGNGNHWTLVGGYTYSALPDSPTNTLTRFNRLENEDATWQIEWNNRNVKKLTTNGVWQNIACDQYHASGKLYIEIQVGTIDFINYTEYGIGTQDVSRNGAISQGGTGNYWCITNAVSGQWNAYDGVSNHAISGWTTNLTAWDVIRIAVDIDAGKVWFGLNWDWDGDPAAGTSPTFSSVSGAVALMFASYGIGTQIQMRADAFIYGAPTGFKPFSLKNMEIPSIVNPREYFHPLAYAGDATDGRIIPTDNIVDHSIIKRTSSALAWQNWDRPRNPTWPTNWPSLIINWDATTVEYLAYAVYPGQTGTGLKLGPHDTNRSGSDYVAYNWTEDAAAGMDIVLYTGDNTSNRQISHGLGVKPEMMWVKNRDNSQNWMAYFEGLGPTYYTRMNTSDASGVFSTIWNDTEPDAAEFTIGSGNAVNRNGDDCVAYLFASVPGFSKVFSYTGNASSDGPYVYCGFKPAFLLIKDTDGAYSWRVLDIARDTLNPLTSVLYPDSTAAETSDGPVDSLANGFKIRTANNGFNNNANFHVGVAFAHYPFPLQGGA